MRQLANVGLVASGVLGVGSIAVAGLGVAVATGHGSTIHGCVAKSDGGLRVVRNAQSCSSRETSLSFNARGPRGPRGPRGAPGASVPAASFQMFANVDAAGDLGSGVGATAARVLVGDRYVVTFAKPIGHCAAVAQSGKAGGSDRANFFISTVVFDSDNANAWDVQFLNADDDTVNPTPFMLTVTCPS